MKNKRFTQYGLESATVEPPVEQPVVEAPEERDHDHEFRGDFHGGTIVEADPVDEEQMRHSIITMEDLVEDLADADWESDDTGVKLGKVALERHAAILGVKVPVSLEAAKEGISDALQQSSVRRTEKADGLMSRITGTVSRLFGKKNKQREPVTEDNFKPMSLTFALNKSPIVYWFGDGDTAAMIAKTKELISILEALNSDLNAQLPGYVTAVQSLAKEASKLKTFDDFVAWANKFTKLPPRKHSYAQRKVNAKDYGTKRGYHPDTTLWATNPIPAHIELLSRQHSAKPAVTKADLHWTIYNQSSGRLLSFVEQGWRPPKKATFVVTPAQLKELDDVSMDLMAASALLGDTVKKLADKYMHKADMRAIDAAFQALYDNGEVPGTVLNDAFGVCEMPAIYYIDHTDKIVSYSLRAGILIDQLIDEVRRNIK